MIPNEEIVSVDKKSGLSKKKILIIALAVAVLIAGIIIFLNVFLGDSKDDNDEPTFENTLKTEAEARVRAYYYLQYGKTPTVQTATVRYNSDGTWTVAGKVRVADDYGDMYSANWYIIYEVLDNGVPSEDSHDFPVPRKSS